MTWARVRVTPPARRHADNFSEKIAEMRLVHKPAFHRNLCQRILGHQHEALSTLDTLAYDVLVRRTTECLLEDAAEPIWAIFHHPDEIHHSDGGM